ncbi:MULTISPECIES: GIY-YIG nuclease family protein [unclassified Streptomyces]|uniref:GIY-YIG nuclease family protein n=1 Tax=unclassified Streptomyces TaxID=2593676 RepID=UPI00114CF765|nr:MULTISPECIES: GIY-YIG nuclease family protein [unclassified Streptomyces]MYQ87622.1 GIY-YIG nuclease family protein [Streptomyces sp. SID4936]
MDTIPLETAKVAEVPDSAGIYQLFHNDRAVFAGRAERSLRSRLLQTQRKLIGRQHISVQEMAFRVVPMDALLVDIAPERLIIQSTDHPWNQIGFGVKDPGRQRDRTALASSHFDLQYPIDLDWIIPQEIMGESLPQLLQSIRSSLPYLFRYGKNYPDQPVKNLRIASRTPAREVFAALSEGPLRGWQITAKPGYVIAYEERYDYPQSLDVFRQ